VKKVAEMDSLSVDKMVGESVATTADDLAMMKVRTMVDMMVDETVEWKVDPLESRSAGRLVAW
jgi:hypothetical protein